MLAPSRALKPSSSKLADAKDEPDPERVDERLRLLSRHTLPDSPYLLSVPSDRPYHADPRQRHNWRIGLPFEAHEEELQYMSFLPRNGDDSLLVARADWDKGGAAGTLGAPKSGTATPVNGVKKKISLSAYKRKQKARTEGDNGQKAEEEPAAQSKPVGAMASKAGHEMPATKGRVSEGSGNQKPPKQPPKENVSQEPPPQGQKRSAEAMKPIDRAKGDRHTEPSPKRPRTSSSSSRPEPDVLKTHKQAEGSGQKLPPLLSPTLPPKVEQELAKQLQPEPSVKQPAFHKKTLSSASSASDAKRRTDGLKPPATDPKHEPNSTTAGKSPRKGPRNAEVKKKEGSDRSLALDAKNSSKPTRPVANGSAGSSYFDALRGGTYQSPSLGPTSKVEKTDPNQKRLVAKLKYGRENRKTVERLLKMRPQPTKIKDGTPSNTQIAVNDPAKRDPDSHKKEPSMQEKDRNRLLDAKAQDKPKVEATPKHQKTGDSQEKSRPKHQPSTGEKRARAPEDERSQDQPAKRPRASELDDTKRPHTPVPSASRPSTLSKQGSAEKSQHPTPKKDLKGTALRRVEAADARATTPQGVQEQHGDSVLTPNQKHVPANETKESEIQAWRAEFKEKTALGKKLKSEASELLRSKSEGSPSENKTIQRGAALAVESVLCYILAFTADDNMRRLSSKAVNTEMWRTLVPLWDFVEQNCRPFPHLHGFCLQLGAIVREVVHTEERNALNNDIKSSSHVSESRQSRIAELFANDRARERLWREGWKLLTADSVRQAFPKTWARRMVTDDGGVSIRQERLTPGQWGGHYRCPLMSNVSRPVEAVRMGAMLLKEWAELNALEWRDALGVL